jgi:copper homeostasis protein
MYLALKCGSLTLHSFTTEAITGWWKLRSRCKVRKILREPREPRIERPITVCFHRAFDMTRSAVEGMSIVICHGRTRVNGSGALVPAFDQICTIPSVTRILTRWIIFHRTISEQSLTFALTRSGQSVSAPAGLHVLQELLQRSQKNGGPLILPGAGINPGTVHHVLENLLPYGLKEIHLSGGKWVEGQMAHRPVGMDMSASEENEWKVWLTDGDTIREVRSVADRCQ